MNCTQKRNGSVMKSQIAHLMSHRNQSDVACERANKKALYWTANSKAVPPRYRISSLLSAIGTSLAKNACERFFFFALFMTLSQLQFFRFVVENDANVIKRD